MSIDRDELAGRLGDLPTLPFIAAKLLDTLEDSTSSALDIARIITADQATSSRLLRLANSAVFGVGRPISTLRDAVVLIGYQGVRRIALGIAVLDNFRPAPAGSRFDFNRLWLHAIGVGCVARRFAPKLGVDQEEGFLCGLLHDMGKVVLAYTKPEDYGKALERCETDETPLSQAEREVFGFDHSEVAETVMSEWRFPPQVLAAASQHHSPSPDHEYVAHVALVHAGNCLARQGNIGYSGDPSAPVLEDWVGDMVGLTAEGRDELLAEILAEARERWRLLMPEA